MKLDTCSGSTARKYRVNTVALVLPRILRSAHTRGSSTMRVRYYQFQRKYGVPKKTVERISRQVYRTRLLYQVITSPGHCVNSSLTTTNIIASIVARLTPSTEVFYRQTRKGTNTEGEGILCRVTSVIGEGKQRRYEIIDADPDPPTPQPPYRTSGKSLVPIPPPGSDGTLTYLDKGENVLAL
jgi:hypothetical protein